jgi:predicted RNase H-like HicB family nuclease
MPTDIVSDIIRGSLTFVLKMQHTPDLSAISDALRVAQTEAKATAEHTAQALDVIKSELKNTVELVQQSAANIQQNGNTAEEARAAAKDATEVGKATLEVAREIRNKRPEEQANGPMSYAAAAASGVPLAATYNAQSVKQPFAQTLREVIMNIRDPLTVESLRAMNPSSHKLHVQRAIEQSGNENIASVKIVSTNQLKSGDLSIKTASSNEVEALRQYADDWAHRIGSGTTVQIPTFGVLAHGIRTSTMDMSKLNEIRAQILQDNRPFIPRAEIRHISWLTRDASAKTSSTITIEFTKPEDANKIIDEGLIWQGEVFQR